MSHSAVSNFHRPHLEMLLARTDVVPAVTRSSCAPRPRSNAVDRGQRLGPHADTATF